jgi:RHS repeat-associated protein
VFAYDAAARRESATTAAGRTVKTTYDDHGRVVRVERGDGVAPVTYEYDADGFLRRAAQGDTAFRFEPDGRGRPAARIDAAGRRTEFTYDDDDRVVAVTRPGGATERYEYDGEGARTAVVLPSGHRHVLGRDGRGALSAYTPVTGAAFTRAHNADGQVTAEGGTTFGYEAGGGRATGASWDDAAVAYTYADALDRPSAMSRTPAGGGTAETDGFTFDGAQTTGIAIAGTAQGAYTYGYDGDGFLTSSKLVSGAQTVSAALTRDKDGMLTGDGPFTIARGGPDGAPSAISGAGLDETLTQDGQGRLKTRALSVGGSRRYRVELTYDDTGAVSHRVETVGAATHAYDYRYDDAGRLTEVDRDGAPAERYSYDADGNRETRRLDAGAAETSAFDAEDRLTARGGTGYAYDDAGYLTTRGADTFHYDARGELLSATVGATTVAYRYDALGRRVARVQGGQATQYLYGDPGNPLRVTASRSPAGALTTYHYDDAGSLYAFERGGQRYFVGTDQVGTPRVVVDAGGSVQDVRDYDAFGNLVSDSQPGFDLPIGYAGGLEDRVTGLVRFGFRDLDTAAGRWTARDPALYDGGQANLYAYVGSDPVSQRDPTGLWCVGGSVYDGIGGGATICHTDEGTAVCFEVGFGIGIDGKVLSPGVDNGALPPDGESIIAEAKANVPGFGVGISAELNNCGQVTPGASADLGVFNVNLNDGTVQAEPPVISEGASIKLAAKVCRRVGG